MILGKTLISAPAYKVTLASYGQGERHEPHRDRHSRVTILLSGSFCEEGRDGAIGMRSGDILLKSYRAVHEDRFGDTGAVIAAMEFVDDDPLEARAELGLLHKRADKFAFRQAAAMLEAACAGDAASAGAAGIDLVTACLDDGVERRPPPLWLARLKEELETHSLAHVDVAARARDGSVHPVHASRLFRQCFGISITEHARAQSVRRALPMIARADLPLSHAALAAGFYDQSHMNRVFQRVLGRTPRAMRTLLNMAAG